MVVEVARELTGEPGCWTDLYFLASFRGLLGELRERELVMGVLNHTGE